MMTPGVGHFVVTYNRSSWLYNQIVALSRYRSRVYSWARTVDDDITRSPDFVQITPNFGSTPYARKASIALAHAQERLFGGASKSLARQMRKDSIAIIHAHFGRAGVYAMSTALETHLPLITSFYGYDIAQYGERPGWKRKYRKLFAQCSAVLCLGARMQQAIVDLGCPPEKARIQHLGVDISSIEFMSRKWDKQEPLRVLIAATFRPKKGIPLALRALGRLKRDIPLQITIIGDAIDVPDSAPEKQRILSEIEHQGLASITSLLGARSYPSLLESAYQHHLFLSTSVTAPDGDKEGTPMVLADMAATGIPIVSSDHSDIPELIKDGQTGLLAAEGDIDSIVEKLTWIVEHPSRWEGMTQKGRKHIESEFDRVTQAMRLESIYDEIISAHL
ncbi:MAG: glycosyltransferase [Chloroflexi bacterium]|nr:glycosyltransferase [Chloroflexota bacterium]